MAPTPSPSSSASSSLVDRVQSFVIENKKVVLIGAAVAAAGGIGYYVYSSSSAPPPKPPKELVDEKDTAESVLANKKKSKKRKTPKDADGPILEERKPKEEPAAEPTLSPAEIEALPETERQKLAAQLKNKGNNAYTERNFDKAIAFYTRAIEMAVKPEAVFYSNRAACYINYQPTPNYEKVVEDCDMALKLDRNYVKALNRRAVALESLGRDEEALRDFTACTILERFQNEVTSNALDRVLKKVATQKASEALATREPRLPSFTFVSAYMAAFRARPPPALPTPSSQGDETLLLAYQALDAVNYTHAFTLVREALEQGISWDEGRAKALNLMGTFKFLLGDTAGAKADLQQSLDILPSFTQTWVKMASVHMELGDAEAAFNAFETAISHNENDPDIYYHRGQVYFIMQQFDAAAEDYNKSTALDDTFVFSHIQYAVAQYKKGEVQSSMASFRKTMIAFPHRSEPQNYYGELLLDTQRFADAVEKFDRAIELEKEKQPPNKVNVLPLVNKALAIYQWNKDMEGARKLCEEALEIDDECDAAIATLAQFHLQASRLDDAIAMFQKHSQIARTSAELEQTYTFEYATRAQKEFSKSYPEKAAELEMLAKSMG